MYLKRVPAFRDVPVIEPAAVVRAMTPAGLDAPQVGRGPAAA